MKYSAHSSTATRTITPPLSTGPSIESTVRERVCPAVTRTSRVAVDPPAGTDGCRPSGLGGHGTGLRWDAALHPAVQHSVRHVLARERERVMIAPVPIDVDEAPTQPLVAEAELADHPQARLVLRPDADLHPVQTKPVECRVGGHRDGGGGDPSSGEALADPVADRRRAQRPAGDAPDVELSGDVAVVLHHEGISGAVPMLLEEAADADAHVERGDAAGDRGLPRLQPCAVRQQLALQGSRVTRADQAQSD